jgi:hypothetical protein
MLLKTGMWWGARAGIEGEATTRRELAGESEDDHTRDVFGFFGIGRDDSHLEIERRGKRRATATRRRSRNFEFQKFFLTARLLNFFLFSPVEWTRYGYIYQMIYIEREG